MKYFLGLLFLTQLAWAQHSAQPSQETNTDLRNQTVLFSITEKESGKEYRLERTQGFSHYLRRIHKGEEVVKKMDSREAVKMDADFSSRFLRCQYSIPSVEGNCEVTLRLMMKSEEQEICEKDDKKTQEITSFIQDISSRF